MRDCELQVIKVLKGVLKKKALDQHRMNFGVFSVGCLVFLVIVFMYIVGPSSSECILSSCKQ